MNGHTNVKIYNSLVIVNNTLSIYVRLSYREIKKRTGDWNKTHKGKWMIYILTSIIPFQYFHGRMPFLKMSTREVKLHPPWLLSVTKLTINLINSSSLGWRTYSKSFLGKYPFMIINHFVLNSIWTQISIKLLK